MVISGLRKEILDELTVISDFRFWHFVAFSGCFKPLLNKYETNCCTVNKYEMNCHRVNIDNKYTILHFYKHFCWFLWLFLASEGVFWQLHDQFAAILTCRIINLILEWLLQVRADWDILTGQRPFQNLEEAFWMLCLAVDALNLSCKQAVDGSRDRGSNVN